MLLISACLLASLPVCAEDVWLLSGERFEGKVTRYDAQGHLRGDEVLKLVARNLSDIVSVDDYVARLGGDEFGILLAGVAPSDALERVEKLRCASVRNLGNDEPLTASAGFSS